MSSKVTLSIDGRQVTVPVGTTIYEAARQQGIDIPALCHDPRMEPVGVCRMCVVDVGQRVLAAACVRPCEEGMQVVTGGDSVERHRRMLTLLLLSEQPEESRRETTTGDDALYALARRYRIEEIPLPDGSDGQPRGEDHSSPVIAVDHQACILCDRCLRGCNEIQHNNVITRTGKGYTARIAFDLDTAMGESSCVACGECAAVCPTGALTHKSAHSLRLDGQTAGDEP